MEQLVKVRQCNDDGTALVLCLRQSACSGDCHKCAGCGAVEQKLLFSAQNPIGAKPGETVRVRTRTGSVRRNGVVYVTLGIVFYRLSYCRCLAVGNHRRFAWLCPGTFVCNGI